MPGARVSQVSVRRYAERGLGRRSSRHDEDIDALQQFRRSGVDIDEIRERLHRAGEFALENLAPVVHLGPLRVVMFGAEVDTVQRKPWLPPKKPKHLRPYRDAA